MKFILTIVFALMLNPQSLYSKIKPLYAILFDVGACSVIKDTLTGQTVYISADTPPQNEGGKIAFLKKCQEINAATSDTAYGGLCVIAFVIDSAGNIYGERIVKSADAKASNEIISIVKSFRWTPAFCNGKKVTMLYTLEINFDPSEN